MATADPFGDSLDSTLAALERRRIEELRTEVSSFAPDLNDPAHIADLRSIRALGRLCLVLGAGVSVPYSVPNWQDLIVALHNEYLPNKDPAYIADVCGRFGISLISMTRFIAAHSVNPTAFLHILHKKLYERHTLTGGEPNLISIGEVLADCVNRDPFALTITYNIDDVLERIMEGHAAGCSYRSVYTARAYAEPALGCRIIHPHGFLPLNATDLSEYLEVVLSEAAYHSHYLHHFHWANMAQLEAFTQKVCIFIGLSFSDPNLRRLLDFSRTFCQRRFQHFVVKRAEPDNHYNYFFQKDMEILGVTVIWIKDYANIADVLHQVMT